MTVMVHVQSKRVIRPLQTKGAATMIEVLNAPSVATPELRPDLTPRECEVLVAWIKADTTEPALAELGINLSALNKYLRGIRDKYAALGRPARTSASLMDRVIEDLAGGHRQNGLLSLSDFTS